MCCSGWFLQLCCNLKGGTGGWRSYSISAQLRYEMRTSQRSCHDGRLGEIVAIAQVTKSCTDIILFL